MYALFPDVGSFFFFFPFLSPFSPPSLFLSLSLSFMFYSWKIFVFKKLASFHNEDPWVLVQFKQLLNFFGLTFLMCKLRMMIHTSHCCFKGKWHHALKAFVECLLQGNCLINGNIVIIITSTGFFQRDSIPIWMHVLLFMNYSGCFILELIVELKRIPKDRVFWTLYSPI